MHLNSFSDIEHNWEEEHNPLHQWSFVSYYVSFTVVWFDKSKWKVFIVRHLITIDVGRFCFSIWWR